MLKIIFVLLVLAVFSTVIAQNQADNSATAKSFIEALSKKDFATAHNYFSDEIKSKAPIEVMPQIWAQISGEFGEFRQNIKTEKLAQSENINLFSEFDKGIAAFTVLFDTKGKIVSFRIDESKTTRKNQPKYEMPAYANSNLFEEREVTVGTDEWALPATLTMPKGKTNVPAIVLVHGSGPNDRDETVGNPANKTFKDLAWGLASKGIAVLRYEKRTRVHGQKIVALPSFTVNEETVDDAILAVELLRKTPNVDAKNIFVLGHSLGGMMIPRIGQRDKNIAGLISFAGLTRKFEDTYVEQVTYLYSLEGTVSKDQQAQIDTLKTQAEAVKKLKSTDSPQTKTMLGLPVSYWVDLNGYNPPVVAKSLKQPMLILQGESDYQVTMKDFANWKASLGEIKTVTFKSYPNLTHTFMEGLGGKPSPKDYAKTNHVNETVVNDIADWILKTSKK